MQKHQQKSKKNTARPRLSKQKSRDDSPPALAIVGAGRLGTALGRALARAGYRIELVVTNHAGNSRKAAKLIGTGVLPLTSEQLERPTKEQLRRLNQCDLIIIATPDHHINLTAAHLASLLPSQRAGRIALHTSGALSSEILYPLRNLGFAIGSLHPLVSVSDPASGSDLLRQAFFCVEGDPAAVRRARTMVRDLGGRSFTIDPNRKALYHAAAVTASGHVTALFDIALEMLAQCGLTAQQAQEVLLPLLKSAVTNLTTASPAKALTGTFARSDTTTAANHLASIRSENLREALSAYVLLGKRSVRLAAAAGASKSELEKLDALLAKASRLL